MSENVKIFVSQNSPTHYDKSHFPQENGEQQSLYKVHYEPVTITGEYEVMLTWIV